jgi:hypothetical protein
MIAGVACAAALGAALLAPPAHAGGLSVVERAGGAAKKRAIEDYWTPRRMREARPLEAIRSEGGAPRVRRPEKEPLNHPAPFESARVPDPGVYPNTVHGKVFGRLPKLGGYTCSGTVVEAANRSTMITAGHCVTDHAYGGDATKLAFVPAYDRRARPFGTWVFDRLVTQRAWRRRSNFNFDLAGVELSPLNGVLVQDAVGAIPVAPHLPVQQTYVASGYPVNRADSEVMWRCTAPFDGFDPRPLPNGPKPFAIGCDMGFGASGGGMTVDGALASVVSFGYKNHRHVSYGPYFGRKLVEVYEKAANG